MGHMPIRSYIWKIGALVLQERSTCRSVDPANSPHEFEVLMSTTRTASMRGLGGSTRNSRGGSPLSTQRQNFLSAVTNKCW